MKKSSILFLCALSILTGGFAPIEAVKQKRFACEEEADQYLTTHYNLGCSYYNQKDWRSASKEFEKVIFFFPCSESAVEAAYYLAVCYFEMREYDFANTEFSNYLKTSEHPTFFEDAVYYKFCIAEHFKQGKRRRPFKNRYLPKWLSGEELALSIYDEVIAALPNHELTIQSLYSKAGLLRKMGEYRSAIETYQMIIRRFPKDEAVPACYVNIANTYVEQSRYEFQNPDILALADLNARKFAEDFPREENVCFVEDSVLRIKEFYAKGLCDLGLFYERKKQFEAAMIYYQSSIEEFPDTQVAEFCRSRLLILKQSLLEEECIQDECVALSSKACEAVLEPVVEELPNIDQYDIKN